MNRLEARNITYSYDNKVNVIENIQLSVGEGEIVCLLGVSGGGKTTLFNVISGLNRPQQGEILLDGEDITGVPGKISYMLQKDLLLPYRTIEANAALPLIIRGVKKKEAIAKVNPYFAEFGLEGTQKMYPSELSGGMRQRAALYGKNRPLDSVYHPRYRRSYSDLRQNLSSRRQARYNNRRDYHKRTETEKV